MATNCDRCGDVVQHLCSDCDEVDRQLSTLTRLSNWANRIAINNNDTEVGDLTDIIVELTDMLKESLNRRKE